MHVSWGGAEGEEERESQEGSTLSTKPDAGLYPTTLASWPKWKSRMGRLTNEPPRKDFIFSEMEKTVSTWGEN